MRAHRGVGPADQPRAGLAEQAHDGRAPIRPRQRRHRPGQRPPGLPELHRHHRRGPGDTADARERRRCHVPPQSSGDGGGNPARRDRPARRVARPGLRRQAPPPGRRPLRRPAARRSAVQEILGQPAARQIPLARDLAARKGLSVRVDGIGVLPDGVVSHPGYEPLSVMFTPAFLTAAHAQVPYWGAVVRLRPGVDPSAYVAAVRKLVPDEAVAVQRADATAHDVHDATRPEVVALEAFAVLAALLGVVVVGQATFAPDPDRCPRQPHARGAGPDPAAACRARPPAAWAPRWCSGRCSRWSSRCWRRRSGRSVSPASSRCHPGSPSTGS